MIWQTLIETYDNNIDRCQDIAPIAHTKITANIGILIGRNGTFMMASEIDGGVITIVPCTAQSEGRSRNIAPHPIHDNLSYVGILDGYEARHAAYMQQLHDYAYGADVEYAKAVYKYLQHNTIMSDIDSILKNIKRQNMYTANIVFCVYGIKEDTIDNTWTQYYLSKLPKNGVCMVTGEQDYIPDTYPAGIRHLGDFARLIMAKPSQKIDSQFYDSNFRIGYIASQKCCHVLQALLEDDKSYLSDCRDKIKLTNTVISQHKNY